MSLRMVDVGSEVISLDALVLPMTQKLYGHNREIDDVVMKKADAVSSRNRFS